MGDIGQDVRLMSGLLAQFVLRNCTSVRQLGSTRVWDAFAVTTDTMPNTWEDLIRGPGVDSVAIIYLDRRSGVWSIRIIDTTTRPGYFYIIDPTDPRRVRRRGQPEALQAGSRYAERALEYFDLYDKVKALASDDEIESRIESRVVDLLVPGSTVNSSAIVCLSISWAVYPNDYAEHLGGPSSQSWRRFCHHHLL